MFIAKKGWPTNVFFLQKNFGKKPIIYPFKKCGLCLFLRLIVTLPVKLELTTIDYFEKGIRHKFYFSTKNLRQKSYKFYTVSKSKIQKL